MWSYKDRPEKGLRLNSLILLATSALLAGCMSCGGGNTVPAAELPLFGAQRAFADLERQVAFGPRMPGSPGHQQQLNWMISTLQPLAEQVRQQHFTTKTALGGPYEFTNLLAVFSAAASGPVTLLGAHWDTRPVADQDPDPTLRSAPVPGANDGASGVAVLLELARIFHQTPPPHPVYLAFLDAEDSGKSGSGLLYSGYCLGSVHMVQNWPADLARPDRAIILDLVGGVAKPNPRVPVRTDLGANDYFDLRVEDHSAKSAPELVDEIWTIAEKLGHRAFQRSRQTPVIDDHLPFIAAGIPAVDIIDFVPPVWHTVDDTPEYCSPQALRQVGETMVGLIYGRE